MSIDYNEELKNIQDSKDKLIKRAEKEGYRLVNNELTKETFQPVIEIYAGAESDYESSGSYYTYRKIIPISKIILDEIIKLEQTKENLIENFTYNQGISEGLDGFDKFYEITEVGRIEECNITRITEKDELDEEYSLEDGQHLYLEFFFESDNANGYVSVYDMPVEDLDTQESIDMYFKKYLTWN